MRPASDINSYHAHVYYDDKSRTEAATLREAIERDFDVSMGRWRNDPVGPHPQSMYQVAFERTQFPQLVPWLMLNHGTLTVLIHPNTGDDVPDHRDFALWLGGKLELNLEFLQNLPARADAQEQESS